MTFLSKLWTFVISQKANLQNLSVLVFVNFLTAGIGFVTRVKIANTIGKETFGLLAYGLAIASYGGVIIRFGLDRTLVRDLIHYPERFSALVATSLLLRWILFAFVFLGLLAWKLAAGAGSDISWGLLLVIIANSLMAMDLRPVYDSWHKMGRHAVYNLIQRSLYFVLIWSVILVAPKQLSIGCVGAGTLASVVLYLLLQHRWAVARIRMRVKRRKLLVSAVRMARGNVTIWLAAIVCLSFGSFNQLVLKYYHGPAELGGYAAAWQIVAIAMLLLGQVSRIGNPATARVTRPESNGCRRKSFLLKYSCVMAATALPVVIPSVLFPGWIMKTIFKPEYASSAAVLRVLAIYIMLFSLGLVAAQYVVSARMERTYFIILIIGGLLGIILCLILIPRYGGFGAAISLLISHGSAMLGLYWIALIHHVRKHK